MKMKVLLACLNVNGLGGSELYHYELVKELNCRDVDITLLTLRNIDSSDQVRVSLRDLGVRQIDLTNVDLTERFDLVVASQPQVVKFALNTYKNTPVISIIHSEVRSEDPVLDKRISHYIAIRPSIVDLLVNGYGIEKERVSLIYNPIDRSRFKHEWVPTEKRQSDKSIRGLFVGEVLDPIRFNTVSHLVGECIEKDWELLLMSDSKYDFNHPNIKYVEKQWNTEDVIKHVDFTAGILLGRTSLESLCCGIPTYVYEINSKGDILGIELLYPKDEIIKACDSKHVVQQHLKLYTELI